MASIDDWVQTIEPHRDNQRALAAVFGGGWVVNPQGAAVGAAIVLR